jgi:hypothetical protein
MTDYKVKQINNTYFEILLKEGIPEKYVRSYDHTNGTVTVTLITGKTYSKKIKSQFNVEATGDVREGLVQRAGESSTESSISRNWAETAQHGEEWD